MRGSFSFGNPPHKLLPWNHNCGREKYGGRINVNNTEELLTVTLERQPGKHYGIRFSGSCPEPGIFIVEILEDSITANDGRVKPYDCLLFINGTDVRHCKISQASDLIKVSFIVIF